MKKTKRNRIKKIPLLLAVVVLIASMLSACGTEEKVTSYYDLDVVEATPDFYVNDFAGIFSEEQKAELMEKAVSFDEEYAGIQVVITTVNSLNDAVLNYELVVEDADGNRIEDEEKERGETPKFTVEQVAYSMYSQYGIGQDDMGVLILFSTGTSEGDGDVRIENGRQMQFYITDGLSGELLDNYAMEYFFNDQYAEGLISLQAAVIDEIKKQVPADWYLTANSTEEAKTDSETTGEATGIVAGEAGNNSDVATNQNSETKDSGKGILWGLFGSIIAAIAAIVAFIKQKLKGDTERQNLEKAKVAEVNSLKEDFNAELARRDSLHEQEIQCQKRNYQSLRKEKDREISRLEKNLNQANGIISTLTKELEVITDKYERAQRLHPDYNFDEEVHEMIESEFKATAQDVDCRLANVLATVPTKDNYEVFSDAIRLFDSVQSEVRKYVTSDIAAIKNLYNEAIRLKEEHERAEQEKRDKASAQKVYNQITGIFDSNPRGNYQTYEELHYALAIFLELSAAEKAFFPDNSLIERLKRTVSEAEVDYKNYNVAKVEESRVRSIIGSMSSADEDDRDKLERAKRHYTGLTSAQQKYFSDELLNKLNRLIDEADDDHRRQQRRRDQEAARRREQEAAMRRAQQQRSSSMSHSSSRSSFGGRGGRPSGGGASRKF